MSGAMSPSGKSPKMSFSAQSALVREDALTKPQSGAKAAPIATVHLDMDLDASDFEEEEESKSRREGELSAEAREQELTEAEGELHPERRIVGERDGKEELDNNYSDLDYEKDVEKSSLKDQLEERASPHSIPQEEVSPTGRSLPTSVRVERPHTAERGEKDEVGHLKLELSRVRRILNVKESTLARLLHENSALKESNTKLTETVSSRAMEAVSGPSSSSYGGATEKSLSHTYFNQRLASWFQRSGSAASLGSVPLYSSPVVASPDAAIAPQTSQIRELASVAGDDGSTSERNRPMSGKFSSVQGSSALADKISALVGEEEEEEEERRKEEEEEEEEEEDVELMMENEITREVERRHEGEGGGEEVTPSATEADADQSEPEEAEEERAMGDMEAALTANDEDDDNSSTDSAFGHHGVSVEQLQHGHVGLTLADVASPDNASYMSAGSQPQAPPSLTNQPVSPMGLYGDVDDEHDQDEHPETFAHGRDGGQQMFISKASGEGVVHASDLYVIILQELLELRVALMTAEHDVQ